MFRMGMVALSAVVVLVGCGGGGDAQQSVVTPVPVAVNNPVVPVTANPPAVTPAVVVPSNVPTPLAGVNLRIGKDFPVADVACGVATTNIEVSAQLSYAVWIGCATNAAAMRVEVNPLQKQISIEYGDAEKGIVVYRSTQDDNAQITVDAVKGTVKIKHVALPRFNYSTGVGGVLPTTLMAISIDGELKYKP